MTFQILLDKWTYVNLTKLIDEIDPVEWEYPKFKPYEKDKINLLLNAIGSSSTIEIINLSNFKFKLFDNAFTINLFENLIKCKNLHTLYLNECGWNVSNVFKYMLNKLLSKNKIKTLDIRKSNYVEIMHFIETLKVNAWRTNMQKYSCENLTTYLYNLNYIDYDINEIKTLCLTHSYNVRDKDLRLVKNIFNKLKTMTYLDKIEIIFIDKSHSPSTVKKIIEQPLYKYKLISRKYRNIIDYKYYSNIKISAEIKIDENDYIIIKLRISVVQFLCYD